MSYTSLSITVRPDGTLAAIHNDALVPLYDQGKVTVRRASFVEPMDGGEHGLFWMADLSPVGGPKMENFTSREKALAAEFKWLKAHGY